MKLKSTMRNFTYDGEVKLTDSSLFKKGLNKYTVTINGIEYALRVIKNDTSACISMGEYYEDEERWYSTILIKLSDSFTLTTEFLENIEVIEDAIRTIDAWCVRELI